MHFLWLIRTESYKKGMVFSMAFNIIAKGILFLLTILIAAFFGSGIKTDIYFFVYGAMVLFSGFINTIDTVVLIPESMRLREKEGDGAAMAFLNVFFRIYLLTGIAFVVLMFLFGTGIFIRISRFSEADILAYQNYFLLGSLYFLFQVLTNYINAILSSLKFFTVPMIISGINSCIMIAGIILLRRQFDVLGIFIGGIIAYCTNLVLLLILMKKFAGWNFFTGAAKVKKITWSHIGFAQLGQLATTASSFFPLYLLSGFGEGVISVMNYGKNIADIPNSLVTAQVTGVSGIQFNEQAARGDDAGMNDTFLQMGKWLLFILVPAGFFLFVFAKPVIQVFYQGKNFSAADAGESAVFLRLLSVTIFSIGINALVTRIFIATQSIRQSFIYQAVMNILLILAIWIFTKYYGAYGYPYGIILMNCINYILMYFICKKLVQAIRYNSLLKHTGVLLLVNGLVAAGLYFADPCGHLGLWGGLLSGFFAYLILLLLVNRLFRINPLPGQVLNYITKRQP